MLVSQLAPAIGYPQIQNFIVQLLDMQFAEVRAMLQLPRPDIDITPACNFAIVSSLCNLISGISTTIYKPIGLLGEVRCDKCSKRAFKELVTDHFPYTPRGIGDFPEQLYQLCRNPLAHSAGVINAPAPVVAFTRIFHAAHEGIGWTDQELEDLEDPGRPQFCLSYAGITADPQQWTVHCDSFYLDLIEMLRRLTSNRTQMTAAENRFRQGVFNWHH